LIQTDYLADVVRVPLGALIRDGDEWAVFRVQDGCARLTSVELALRGDRFVEIRGGVSEGDELIIYPGDELEDGVRVERRE